MPCLNVKMNRIKKLFSVADDQIRRFGSDQSAATAIEYAMIAAGVAACISGVVWNLGSTLKSNFYDKLASLLP
jgi:pilus assembly protein Flp/PilA